MRMIRLGTIIVCLFCFLKIHAQVSSGGVPPSFKGINYNYNEYELPVLDNEYERQRADSVADEMVSCTECVGNEKPSFYGRGMELSVNVLEEAHYEEFGDSIRLWKLMLHSETALGLQFYFEEFYLPEGAELFIYSADSNIVLGAFTEQNHNPDSSQAIPFGTQPVWGNEIIFEIEYKKPSVDMEWETPSILLTNTIHIFEEFINLKNTSYGTSLSCNIDVKCTLGNGWGKEIKSVALILGYNEVNELAAHCSGVILNNPDKHPYLLTANHCIIPKNYHTTPAELQRYNSNTWTFLFNHQRVACNNSISSFYGDSFYGSKRLAPSGTNNQPPSDYLLLNIWSASENIFAQKGICYAGWNKNNSTPTGPYIGIHHPSGDVKKISKFSGTLLSTDFYGNIDNSSKTHWKVSSWTQGTTEGGSSGSPLFDNNHQVIGQLHGGDAACNNLPDWYGKFSKSWNHGGFGFWLDPANTNVTTMSSYCPTTSSGGGGGGGTPICYGDISTSNFLVNGNISDDVNVCLNDPVVLEMPNSPYGDICYFPMLLSKKRRSLFSPGACSQLRNVDYYNYWETVTRCHIRYKQLFVSIQEVNANNTPIGPEISEWIYFDRKTNYYDPHNNSTNNDKLKSFDLKEFSPHNYTLLPFKRYRLKIANSIFQLYLNGVLYPHHAWYEKVKYINTNYPSFHANNSNINFDITANNISFKNLTVSNSNVRASNKIEVLENTTLSANSSYSVDISLACLSPPSYRLKNPANNNQNRQQENQIEQSSSDLNNELIIFPNPTEDNIEVKIQNENLNRGLYKIYNSNGVQLVNGKFSLNTFQIHTDELPNGIYLIQLNTGGQILNSKFIKQ